MLHIYFSAALELAGNPARLSELRSTLRHRLLASPLCDGVGASRKVEAAYRDMWTRFCTGET